MVHQLTICEEMTETDRKLLRQLLDEHLSDNATFLQPYIIGIPYKSKAKFTLANGQVVSFADNTAILKRVSRKHPNQARYETVDLTDKPLASGKFGVVRPVTFSLKPAQDDDVQIKAKRTKVAKFINNTQYPDEINILKDVEEGKAHGVRPGIPEFPRAIITKRHPGQTLKSLMESKAGKSLGLGERLNLALEITKRLHEIHKKGYVHRDLKPDNIMVDVKSGKARIIDFGLSHKSDAKNIPYLRGNWGTFAPELFTALKKNNSSIPITTKVDHYGLAGILFYLLGADQCFDNKPKGKIEKIKHIERFNRKGLSQSLIVFGHDFQLMRLLGRLEAEDPKDRPDLAPLIRELELARVCFMGEEFAELAYTLDDLLESTSAYVRDHQETDEKTTVVEQIRTSLRQAYQAIASVNLKTSPADSVKAQKEAQGRIQQALKQANTEMLGEHKSTIITLLNTLLEKLGELFANDKTKLTIKTRSQKLHASTQCLLQQWKKRTPSLNTDNPPAKGPTTSHP